MYDQCFKPCPNKTDNGFCKTTTCINPLYSNIGTAQYGQGVQKRIVTNADKIRAMTDVELANMLAHGNCGYCKIHDYCFSQKGVDCDEAWLDWLRQEAMING